MIKTALPNLEINTAPNVTTRVSCWIAAAPAVLRARWVGRSKAGRKKADWWRWSIRNDWGSESGVAYRHTQIGLRSGAFPPTETASSGGPYVFPRGWTSDRGRS